MKSFNHQSFVEINLDNIFHNVKEIRDLVGDKIQIMSIVKSDAYGHGLIEVAKTVIKAGSNWLGVADLKEAIELRENGITSPILILGAITPEDAQEVIKFRLTSSVFTMELANALSRISNEEIKVHVKVDTGMGRFGVPIDDAEEFIKHVVTLPKIKIEGLFSHLATSDSSDKSYANIQFTRFQSLVNRLEEKGIYIPIKHIANSGAILDLKNMWLDLVRPGITIYGLFPSPEVSRTLALRPAMEFKTRVCYLKKLPKDFGVSYGKTYTTKRETLVAILPVGYANGLSHSLSNKGEVLIKGKRCKIIGRVTMDFCMVDVTDVSGVEVGDEVVIFGSQGGEWIGVDEIAEKISTINYEILCMVGNCNKRVYVKKENFS